MVGCRWTVKLWLCILLAILIFSVTFRVGSRLTIPVIIVGAAILCTLSLSHISKTRKGGQLAQEPRLPVEKAKAAFFPVYAIMNKDHRLEDDVPRDYFYARAQENPYAPLIVHSDTLVLALHLEDKDVV